jgi:hypothetical protein
MDRILTNIDKADESLLVLKGVAADVKAGLNLFLAKQTISLHPVIDSA